jgi:hypothetical protein
MKRQPKGSTTRRKAVQVWTYAQALKAVPYLASVVRSLREHATELAAARGEERRLNERPGRPDRTALIALEQTQSDARRAEAAMEDDLDELERLDVFSLDPFRGQALVPFAHEDQLAWYVFDLFEPNPYPSWRFQSDPEDTRRPVTALQKV